MNFCNGFGIVMYGFSCIPSSVICHSFNDMPTGWLISATAMLLRLISDYWHLK